MKPSCCRTHPLRKKNVLLCACTEYSVYSNRVRSPDVLICIAEAMKFISGPIIPIRSCKGHSENMEIPEYIVFVVVVDDVVVAVVVIIVDAVRYYIIARVVSHFVCVPTENVVRTLIARELLNKYF